MVKAYNIHWHSGKVVIVFTLKIIFRCFPHNQLVDCLNKFIHIPNDRYLNFIIFTMSEVEIIINWKLCYHIM